jgi:hypothetical protein
LFYHNEARFSKPASERPTRPEADIPINIQLGGRNKLQEGGMDHPPSQQTSHFHDIVNVKSFSVAQHGEMFAVPQTGT